MALQFVAVIGPNQTSRSETSTKVSSKSKLLEVFSGNNLTVYASNRETLIELPDGNGIILGHLFKASSPYARVDDLGQNEAKEIWQSDGQHLISEYWGGYVAFVRGGYTPQITVLRDPSGALPCYYFRSSNEEIILASDIEALSECGLFIPQVSWSGIGQHLFSGGLRTSETCFDGLRELLAGYSLCSCGGALTIRQRWDPWDFVQTGQVLEGDQAADELKRIVTQSTGAWAGCFKNILLGVSGGLDSSIVASVLSERGAQMTCFTMITDDPTGDERLYARMLTRHLRQPLVEKFHNAGEVNLAESNSLHVPRPNFYALGQSTKAAKFDLAKAIPYDGFFSGVGGDNVFCFLSSATPLVDRVRKEGLGAGAWATAIDICDMTDCSLFDVVMMAAKRMMDGDVSYKWRTNSDFLLPDAPGTAVLDLHPWLDAPTDALPGKAVHIAMLARIQGTIDGYSRRRRETQITPLICQPVMEFCLGIPTWLWCAGGQNRSVARRAFAGQLPPEIISRRSKGGPSGFAFDLIMENRAVLRELILDGELVRHGIIDKVAMDAVLVEETLRHSDKHLRIMSIADAEAWARHWS